MKTHSFFLFAIIHTVLFSSTTYSNEKQDLAEEVLNRWKVENKVISMVQRAGTKVLAQSNAALQGRVTEEQKSKVMKSIGSDVQRYVDEATPIVSRYAKELKFEILLPIIIDEFSEDELAELIRIFDSPVKNKFEGLLPNMEAAYGGRVAEKSGEVVNSKLSELSASVSSKLRAAAMGQ